MTVELLSNARCPSTRERDTVCRLDACANIELHLGIADNERRFCNVIGSEIGHADEVGKRLDTDRGRADVAQVCGEIIERLRRRGEAKHDDPIVVSAAHEADVDAASKSVSQHCRESSLRIRNDAERQVLRSGAVAGHVGNRPTRQAGQWKRR